jgi:hypothetical protein
MENIIILINTDDDLMENFIQVIISKDPIRTKWDYATNSDKYFKMKDKYYDKKFEDEMTGQLKFNF